MDFINELKIKGKLSLVAIVTCILLIIVIVFSFIKTKSVVSLAAQIQSQTQINVSTSSEVRIQWNELVTNSLGMMIAGNSKQNGQAQQYYSKTLTKLSGTLKEYAKVSADTSAAIINQIGRTVNDYDEEVRAKLYPAIAHNDLEKYVEFREITIKEYSEKVRSFLSNLDHEQGMILNEQFNDLDGLANLTWLGFTVILFCVISVTFANIIGGIISKNIRFVNGKCQRIAEGDLTMNLEEVTVTDEVGELARSLQKLVVRNHKNISDTVSVAESFLDSTKKISKISSTILRSSKEVVSQSMAVSAASDELVINTNNIASNCREANNNSDDAKRVTLQGMEAVKEAVERIRNQSLRNKEDSAAVFALGQQIDRIDAVVTTIQEIAEQTNLLALNASIEAARAGEHGRGFAVVADEVRALAERTTQSTQEITEMVKSIHEETSNATKSMATSVESMDAVADYAEHLEDSLSEILTKVEMVNSQINRIANESEQQSSTTTDISNNMRHITEAIQLIANHSNIQNNDANALSKTARTMQTACKQYHL